MYNLLAALSRKELRCLKVHKLHVEGLSKLSFHRYEAKVLLRVLASRSPIECLIVNGIRYRRDGQGGALVPFTRESIRLLAYRDKLVEEQDYEWDVNRFFEVDETNVKINYRLQRLSQFRVLTKLMN